ncbi:hypothetical protein Ocin01_03848 [Orchesella cincta]|uniref:Uncharacterized protein n=1 Tax=Orchesella cincta TaxID=48709 RepID=A0A1D2NC49_ORCCI|nr:hypothetical protein Ocin01_03848 [Orchesella cincta]
MDYLGASGLEPQLAIPVIVMVVGALLVYVFGFQKSEEPSLEHLAVLQSTSSYKARSVSNTKSKSNGVANKTKEKPAQNGHVVHEKPRAAEKKKESPTNNKENKPPKPVQTSSKKVKQEAKAARPADFDSGEWNQVTSRKDKKKQVKKEEPKEVQSSPEKSSREPEKPKKVEVEEIILQEAQVQVQSQTTQTTPKVSPEKKAKKGAKDVSTTTGSSGPSSKEASPAKQKPKETETVIKQDKKAPEVVTVNGVSEESEESSPASSPAKKLSTSEDAPAAEPKKGVVAFDEMGGEPVDAWEEAKSRGNKKRRARKD